MKDLRGKWSGFGSDLGQLSSFHPFEKLSILDLQIEFFFKL